MKKLHDLFETMAEYKNIGMIDFDINYKGDKRIQIIGIENFLELAQDKDIYFNDREQREFPFEAEFYREGIRFMTVLEVDEKTELKRRITERQVNDFINSLEAL